jgi:dTDP-4-dehydrorhamnose reductase
MRKILVLGSNGALGTSICKTLKKKKFFCFAQSRSKRNKYFCNFKNKLNFKKLIEKIKPNIVINTISNININECEQDFYKCHQDNIQTAKIISDVCGDKKIKQIYISSDQVYSGKGPHKENKIKPLNNYGISKIIAENLVLHNNGTVLRVNFIHKDKKKRTFHDQIINSYKIKKFFLYKDIFFNPLHISTLSEIIVENLVKFKNDVYNIGAYNKISKEKFIIKFCNKMNIKGNFKSVNYSSNATNRPKDMNMDIKKISRLIKFAKYDIYEEINKLVNDYK